MFSLFHQSESSVILQRFTVAHCVPCSDSFDGVVIVVTAVAAFFFPARHLLYFIQSLARTSDIIMVLKSQQNRNRIGKSSTKKPKKRTNARTAN